MSGLVLSGAIAGTAWAEPAEKGPTRLSAAVGASFPHGALDWDPAFSWGFFVDLPLVSHFYVSPSAVLYTLAPEEQSGVGAVDVSLSFKFGFPIDMVELFAGVTTGLTSADQVDVHFGGLAGASFQLLDNLDLFAQFNYRVILADSTNIQDAQVFAGPAFRF